MLNQNQIRCKSCKQLFPADSAKVTCELRCPSSDGQILEVEVTITCPKCGIKTKFFDQTLDISRNDFRVIRND